MLVQTFLHSWAAGSSFNKNNPPPASRWQQREPYKCEGPTQREEQEESINSTNAVKRLENVMKSCI